MVSQRNPAGFMVLKWKGKLLTTREWKNEEMLRWKNN